MTQIPEVNSRTEVRDGMRITWHQPIPMDDGIVLRADVYRPIDDGTYPVILTYGIYAKGLLLPGRLSSAVAEDGRGSSGDPRGVDEQVSGVGSHRSRAVGPPRVCCDPGGFTGRRLVSGVSWIFNVPRRTTTFTSASSGQGLSPGATARSGCSGSPTTPSTSGGSQQKTLRTWPQSSPGRASTTSTVTPPITAGSCNEFMKRWAPIQALIVQYGLGERAKKNPNTGESIAGPITLSDEELAKNRVNVYGDLLNTPAR